MRSQAGAPDDGTLSASRLISSVFSRPFYLFIFIELHHVCNSGQVGGFNFFLVHMSVCFCSNFMCMCVCAFVYCIYCLLK